MVQPLEVGLASTNAFVFMDKLVDDFLKTQEPTSLLWYRYLDDIFFIENHRKETLHYLTVILIITTPTSNLLMSSIKKIFHS